MVDSLPDPVVITNAANDIIAQNQRAERLLHTRDDDSPGRRRARRAEQPAVHVVPVASAAMTGGAAVAGRASSISSTRTRATTCCSRCSRIRSASASGRRTPCCRCCATSPTCAARRTSSSARCSACARRRSRRRGERDRLNLILENVADPILVTDERSNIILMNDEAEQLFQIREADGAHVAARSGGARQRHEVHVVHLRVRAARRRLAPRAHVARRIRAPASSCRSKSCRARCSNERGEPIAIVSVLHDLTKQVENERLYEALKQLNSELEERIRAATRDLARAERAAPVAVAGARAREPAQVGISREHVARAAHADQRASSATRRCCSTACSAT